MRLKLSHFFTTIGLGLTTVSVFATTTTLNTVPEGLFSLDFALTDSTHTSTSYFSLPLIADPVYTGAVSSATANTITVADSPAPFVSGNVGVQLGTLATSAEPFYVKFLTGAEAGRVVKVTANTSSTLTLDTTDNSTQTVSLLTSGFAVAATDTFEIFPGTTLGSLFGENTTQNPLLLHGATNLFLSDTVSVYNSATARFQTYYFNTASGTNAWVLSGTTTAVNDTVIPPYSGIVVVRRSSEAALSIVPTARITSIATSGGAATDSLVPLSRVTEVSGLIKATGSGHLAFTSTLFPVDMTLSQMNLGPNWVKSDSAFVADSIAIWNPQTAKFDTYYQRLSDSHWRKIGDAATVQDTLVTLHAGSSFLISQRTTPTQSDGTTFLSSAMPYNLNTP